MGIKLLPPSGNLTNWDDRLQHKNFAKESLVPSYFHGACRSEEIFSRECDFICNACDVRLRKKKSSSSVSVTQLAKGEKYIHKIDVANKAHSQKMNYKTISEHKSNIQILPTFHCMMFLPFQRHVIHFVILFAPKLAIIYGITSRKENSRGSYTHYTKQYEQLQIVSCDA